MTGNAAAKCYVVVGRKISGESGWVPFQEEMQTFVNIQVHSPHPALISPPPSNLAAGGFALQNLSEASNCFPNEMLVRCYTGDVPPESWLTFAVNESLWFFTLEIWGSWWAGLFLEFIPYLVYPSILVFIYLCIYLLDSYNRKKESRMVVAKRQRREKPMKIEERKVRGPKWGPQVKETALLASPIYIGQARGERKKNIKRVASIELGASFLFNAFGLAHPHASKVYFHLLAR